VENADATAMRAKINPKMKSLEFIISGQKELEGRMRSRKPRKVWVLYEVEKRMWKERSE
jgi:hypothetical protein